MDTLLTYLQSLTAAGGAQHALFLAITGATAFLFALGISFLSWPRWIGTAGLTRLRPSAHELRRAF
jgi:hypothetical protein